MPRISIVFEDGSGQNQGAATSASLGTALQFAWTLVAVLGMPGFAVGENQAVSASGMAPAPFAFSVGMAVQAVALLGTGLLAQGVPRFLCSRPCIVGSAVAAALGTVAAFYAPALGEAGFALSLAAGAACGIGAAGLSMFWGISFSRLDFASIVVNACIALGASTVLYIMLACLVPEPVDQWLIAALPLLQLPIGRNAAPDAVVAQRTVPLFRSYPVKRGLFSAQLAIAMALFGLSMGITKTFTANGIYADVDTAVFVSVLLLAAACTIAVLLLCERNTDETTRWLLLLRPLMLAVAVPAIALPLLTGNVPAAALLVMLFCLLYAKTAMWVFFTGISQEFRLSAVFTVGIGYGGLVLGMAAGSVVDAFPQLTAVLPEYSWFGIALGAFAVGYVLNPRVGLLRKEALLAQGVSEEDLAARMREAAEADEVVSPAGQLETDETEAAPREAGGGRADQMREALKADTDAYRQACEDIARQHVLSQRQTEVLYLLARGHNAAYIQEKLCITVSTAKSHIYRIYKKLGIHTQHELLAMVEAELGAIAEGDADDRR